MSKFFYFFIKLISQLPFWILDTIGFFLYIFIRHVFKYRYKVVWENIEKSFPEWDKSKIKKTTNAYYKHFIDLIIETLKGLTLTEEKFDKHFKFTNPELLEKYYSEGKNAVVLSGHYANWEWLNNIGRYSNYLSLAVYLPLKNKFWDNLIKEIRERFGAETVPMREIYRRIEALQKENRLFLVGLVSDQCPPPNKSVWSTFLGRNTAYYAGPDKISRMLSAPVFYLSVKKKKRHVYEATYILLSDKTQNLPQNEIIHKFSAALEKDVREFPEMYIWSHKRWKYKKI